MYAFLEFLFKFGKRPVTKVIVSTLIGALLGVWALSHDDGLDPAVTIGMSAGLGFLAASALLLHDWMTPGNKRDFVAYGLVVLIVTSVCFAVSELKVFSRRP